MPRFPRRGVDGDMDDFSDDGFDDLNINILQELENNAIQFTQAQQLGSTQAVNDDDYGLEDDDLDDTVVIDEAAQLPPTAIPQNRDGQFAAILARVKALENDLHSARGEASIVRSKYERSVAAHEAEVSKLKKQNAEALAKQERLVEAAVHAEKAAATELQFTRQDLREELQKSKKGRKESAEATFSTPRKNKTNSFKNIADGFDDVEILPSPSKAQGGLKGKGKSASLAPGERTPSRAKRKRAAIDSPVTALEVEDDATMTDAAPATHFPSDPDQSFAGTIFQKLPSLGDPHDPVRLLIDFCDMIIDLWDQCLREKYYEPIYDLVALITFILQLNTISVAPYIASTLVPVAQTTVFLLAVPRFESQDGDLTSRADETIQHLVLNIDTEGTLQLMYLAALGCTDSYLLDPQHPLDLGPERDSPQRLYWKLMQIDFVLVMLSPKQPRDDFLVELLQLAFDEDEDEKADQKAQQEKPPAESESMEGVDDGTADRPIAVDEDDAELLPPSTPTLPSRSRLDPSPTPLLYNIASSVILLLHTLVTDPATSAHTDMRAKLSTSHGAPQKYLLALSRLNYAEEDLVLEAGIDQGTLDRANELLDLAITPDEAEGVRQVFGA
ncbi:putative dna repair protein rad26 [Diaporthe ampelina]|uniref:Putative dna repair protein rad26 n=1 Tax=Diaporthe ampelina TaxID=1214573 RepID=A0A0G2ID40_9PEZI|nr:putative dna repair protein rad26 [Diaporthe ampelina]